MTTVETTVHLTRTGWKTTETKQNSNKENVVSRISTIDFDRTSYTGSIDPLESRLLRELSNFQEPSVQSPIVEQSSRMWHLMRNASSPGIHAGILLGFN